MFAKNMIKNLPMKNQQKFCRLQITHIVIISV